MATPQLVKACGTLLVQGSLCAAFWMMNKMLETSNIRLESLRIIRFLMVVSFFANSSYWGKVIEDIPI